MSHFSHLYLSSPYAGPAIILVITSIISHIVPCLQSVGISSCLPLCCPSVSFSVDLCSFSQKRLVLAISHRCGCVLALSSGQTTLVFVFQESFNMFMFTSFLMSYFPMWSDLIFPLAQRYVYDIPNSTSPWLCRHIIAPVYRCMKSASAHNQFLLRHSYQQWH